MKDSGTPFIKKYGYKIIIFAFLCYFVSVFYDKYINAEAVVWCYECQRNVPASSTGHKTEPPSDN